MTDEWLRHRQTGDRGKLVTENGEASIRYDRPHGPTIPYRPNEWMPELDRVPLNRSQLARVAFAADRQLLYFMQSYARSKRNWDALTDEERIHWAKEGPASEDPNRIRLFDAIMKCLDSLTK